MRILFAITRAEFGGAQSHVLELLRFAVKQNSAVGLVAGEQGLLSDTARQIGVEVMILPDLVQPLQPSKDIRALGEMRRAIRTFRPDLVHAHSSKAGIIARLAAALEGVPSVFTAHGWAFSEGVSFQRKALAVASERIASRWANKIIAVSEYDRNLALRYHVARSEQLVAIHNGVADTPYLAHSGHGSPVILSMVARFSPPKNQSDFILAARDLKGEFKIEFIGDGPCINDIKALVTNVGLSQRVTFWGARSDVPELLARSQVFVLISKWEGLPVSILEAMRAGLPVVASDVGGVREVVINGETGFLVPNDDIVTLHDQLQRLLDDPGLRIRQGVAGRQRYERYFTSEHMIQRTWEVYDGILLKV